MPARSPITHRCSWRFVATCTLIATFACRPQAKETGATVAPESVVQTLPAGLAVDAQRMLTDIRHLADDALHGRYTLSPDLQLSADWIGKRYKELGLEPLQANYQVPFSMVTGVRQRSPARLAIVRGGANRGLDPAIFQPVALSGSGSVTAPVVFVGYAARAEAAESPAQSPAYDDLADVDLKGKIALILLESPNRPRISSLFKRLQEEQDTFQSSMKELLAADDIDGIKALHAKIRSRLLRLIKPFMRGASLDDLWPLPEDPRTLELDLSSLAGTLIREVSKLKGPRFDMRTSRLRSKLERVIEAGAVGAVVVRGPRSFIDRDGRSADVFQELNKSRINGEQLPIPVIQMKWREADRYLRIGSQKLSGAQASIDRELLPKSRPIRVTLELKTDLETITTPVPNVLAKIPGTDLADELVVFGAHYDHIGADDGVGDCSASTGADGVRDTICNGADDNASGTAMIMEIARAFAERGERPRRTLIFAHFAGEELGLLGSKALADDPPFDMAHVKAMINLDMVGRLGPRGLAIGGIGSSDAWMPLLDEVGTKDMSVLYEASVATRSDHASFYRKSIPVLFFFTGTHSDYHRPGDHTDKINVDGMQSIGEIVSEVGLALADGLEIAYTKPNQGDGFSGGLPGSNPETVIKRVRRGRSSNSVRPAEDAPTASPKTVKTP